MLASFRAPGQVSIAFNTVTRAEIKLARQSCLVLATLAHMLQRTPSGCKEHKFEALSRKARDGRLSSLWFHP